MERNYFEWAEGVVSGIISLTITFFFIGLIGKHYPSYPFYDVKITDYFTVILACLTIISTLSEYKRHQERIKAEVLGQYNERYSRDEHINKVVDFIIRFMDDEVPYVKPSVHNAEMFMRFYEEIQIQIEKGRLEEKQVFDLFAYYAMVFDANERLRVILGINDYDKNEWVWSLFKTFVRRMMISHYIKEFIWEPTYNNAHNNSLLFDRNASHGKNKEDIDIITKFSYSEGHITYENKDFLYVFKGSGEPDELHSLNDNIIYQGTINEHRGNKSAVR